MNRVMGRRRVPGPVLMAWYRKGSTSSVYAVRLPLGARHGSPYDAMLSFTPNDGPAQSRLVIAVHAADVAPVGKNQSCGAGAHGLTAQRKPGSARVSHSITCHTVIVAVTLADVLDRRGSAAGLCAGCQAPGLPWRSRSRARRWGRTSIQDRTGAPPTIASSVIVGTGDDAFVVLHWQRTAG